MKQNQSSHHYYYKEMPGEIMSMYVDHLKFTIENEPWNEYDIENYGKLRIKTVVTRILPFKSSVNDIDLSFKSSRVVDIIPFKEKLGEPDRDTYSNQEILESIVEDDAIFRVANEDWNVYTLEDGRKLRVKSTLVKVSISSKFDSKGEPILLVNTQPIVKIT